MANYTIHLGFNWNSPTIGSIWSSESTDYRFLQYALAGANGSPAWFQFSVDDTFSVVIWDLSSLSPIPDAWSLSMSLAALDAGTPQTYVPSDLLGLSPDASEGSKSVNGQPENYFSFESISFSYGPDNRSPWGTCRGQSSSLGPVSFSAVASFKLSYSLQVTADNEGTRETRVFISDPEVIVGSRG